MQFEVDLYVIGDGNTLGEFTVAHGTLQIVALKSQGHFLVRPLHLQQPTSVEDAITHFLTLLEGVKSAVTMRKCTLRVGVFFSAEKVAAFSVAMSQDLLENLAAFRVDIDVTGYPCSEE